MHSSTRAFLRTWTLFKIVVLLRRLLPNISYWSTVKDEMGRLKSALMLQYKRYPEVSLVVAAEASCIFVFVPCSQVCDSIVFAL
jgi:hypothetical protein